MNEQIKTFDERRAKETSVKGGKARVIRLSELAGLAIPLNSETRLERLPKEVWCVRLFREKAQELQHAANLEARLALDAAGLPDLAADTHFKYDYCFADSKNRVMEGESLLISLVIEESRMIGFAISVVTEGRSGTIEIIDVDSSSRRSSGVKKELVLQGQIFGVGVAHLLVDLIATDLTGAILVDATNSASRYICKSLGFVPRPSESNPCLLVRSAVEAG